MMLTTVARIGNSKFNMMWKGWPAFNDTYIKIKVENRATSSNIKATSEQPCGYLMTTSEQPQGTFRSTVLGKSQGNHKVTLGLIPQGNQMKT